MKRVINIVKWIGPICFIILAVGVNDWCRHIASETVESNKLIQLAEALTEGYRIRQILASIGLYLIGYITVYCTIGRAHHIYACIWAVPVSVTIWSVSGMMLLLLGIPYCRLSAVFTFVSLASILCGKRLKSIRYGNWKAMTRSVLWVIGICIVIATGILPIQMSSDSYYYLMQYGEIVAKTGLLSFDTTGAMMTWTGLSAALLSSFASLMGFETITVIHWGMVISLIGAVYVEIYQFLSGCMQDRKKVVTYTLLFTLTMVLMPPFLLLSSWVISNTYCMCLFYFLMVGLKKYKEQENMNAGCLTVLSLMMVWLCMSRAETCVCVASVVFLVGMIGFSQKEMLFLSVPAAVFQTLFFFRLILQQTASNRSVYDSMYTKPVIVVMLIAVWGAVLYSSLIEMQWFGWLKKKMPLFITIGLPILCVLIFLMDSGKFLVGMDSIRYNILNEFWSASPFLIGILVFLYILFCRKLNFYIMFAYMYIFLNLALCLGRKQPLRYGYGDSCNRILISAIPIVYYALIYSLIKVREERYEKNKTEDGT